MKTIDASGLSCPEPLMMLKNALKTETELIFLVDRNPLVNCQSFAKMQGCTVETTQENDIYRLRIKAPK